MIRTWLARFIASPTREVDEAVVLALLATVGAIVLQAVDMVVFGHAFSASAYGIGQGSIIAAAAGGAGLRDRGYQMPAAAALPAPTIAAPTIKPRPP